MKIKNKRVIEYFKTDDTSSVDPNLLKTLDLSYFNKDDYDDLRNIFNDLQVTVDLPQLFPHEVEILYDYKILENYNTKIKMKTESIFDVSDDLINKIKSQEIQIDEIEIVPLNRKESVPEIETTKQKIDRIIPKIGTIISANQLAKIKELADEVLNTENRKRIDARNISQMTQGYIEDEGIEFIEITGKVESNFISELQDVIRVAKISKFIQFTTEIEGLSGFMENYPEQCEGLILSSDGFSLININNLEEPTISPQEVHIDLDEFTKREDMLIREDTSDSFVLVINNTSELSVEEARRLKESCRVTKVKVFSPENMSYQNEAYDLDTYIAIREKLDELVADIDKSLPEEAKFAIVYQRLGQSIVYDTPAAYPITEEEEKYSDDVINTCRNLKNGLLEGKCVCAGYADILRNALAMVGIESQYTSGTVIVEEIPLEEYEQKENQTGYVYETKEDGKTVVIAEGHAWNKVRLNGSWYNVDLTFDAESLRNGKFPEHCLKSDRDIAYTDKKVDFYGPECNTWFDRSKLRELFKMAECYPKTRVQFVFEEIRDRIAQYADKGKEIVVDLQDKITKFIQRLKEPEVKLLEERNEQTDELSNKRPSWDLTNWNINKNEFNKGVKQKEENDIKNRSDNEEQKGGDER